MTFQTNNDSDKDLAFDVVEGGGVTSALGFRAGGIHAGFRKNPGRLDTVSYTHLTLPTT